MVRINRKAWDATTSALLALMLVTLVGCSEAPDSAQEADDTTMSEAQGIDENLVDPAQATAIAADKIAKSGRPPGVEKHAGCGTKGPTNFSERNDDAPANGAANQRSGSSTSCAALGVLQPTDDALYYCYTFANDGFTWTYNKNLRTGVSGWTRDDLLDDSGSFHPCPF